MICHLLRSFLYETYMSGIEMSIISFKEGVLSPHERQMRYQAFVISYSIQQSPTEKQYQALTSEKVMRIILMFFPQSYVVM